MPIINMAVGETEAEATAEMTANKGANLRSIETPYSKYIGTDEKGASIYENAIRTLYLYDTYIGFCLEDREENGRDDSDWYMLVWNGKKEVIERHEFASTRGWTYPCYGSRPDATPEAAKAATEYLRKRYLESLKLQNTENARKPEFGRLVRVVKGRKVPVGTKGEVCWVGKSDYGKSRFGTWGKLRERVGIRLQDGSKVFTDAANVEVLLPETYEAPVEELVRRAASYTPGTFVTSVRTGFAFL